MREGLLEILRATGSRSPLRLDGAVREGEEIVRGVLRAEDRTAEYEVRDRIPRFTQQHDVAQAETRDAFAFKWAKTDTYDSPASRARVEGWLLQRYGFATVDAWAAYFDAHGRVLDIGCGSGLSSGTWLCSPSWSGRSMWVGVDISTAVDVAQQRLGPVANTHFVQGDALDLPFADGTFGAVFSEGVLHHTPSTRKALLSGARVLAAGGEFSFYVYRRKGAVREFTDDHVRAALRGLSDEEAWEVMRAFTKLGRELSALQATIDVPAIPILGIAGGREDVQRFVYWNFAKLYWNDAMSFEENVHVNFDWYRPAYAHRHSEDELRAWCDEAQLDVRRLDEQESGYTIIARKR